MNEHKLIIASNILYLIAISIITYRWWKEKSRVKLLKLGWQEEIYKSSDLLNTYTYTHPKLKELGSNSDNVKFSYTLKEALKASNIFNS